MNSIKKFLDWLTSLLLIIVVGLILITLFSAYYSFGTMIFGVHEASAIKDFWFTEIMLGTVYVSVVMVIAIYTAITRFLKKRKNKVSS
ncbi:MULTISPECIES: hypothetical protein [Lactobacillus]|uniref:hypothetical protein n=1 Tax=Lactobacillus TaxID=1578 RepID=UPI0018F04F07|nr:MULTISPECIES: hypothetical protein [Lactobacillus]MBI0109950.1 hypothetical protein [Lactobacillus sp. W8093]WLT00425.1 hypothetical protein RAM07_00090 [Lactobacillus helsingborgensis]